MHNDLFAGHYFGTVHQVDMITEKCILVKNDANFGFSFIKPNGATGFIAREKVTNLHNIKAVILTPVSSPEVRVSL